MLLKALISEVTFGIFVITTWIRAGTANQLVDFHNGLAP